MHSKEAGSRVCRGTVSREEDRTLNGSAGGRKRERDLQGTKRALPSESWRFVYLNVADAERGVAIEARDPGDQDTV